MSGGSANGKVTRPGGQQSGEAPAVSVFRRFLGFFGSRNGDSQLRETIEEIIEEIEESANDEDANVPIGDDEPVADVMCNTLFLAVTGDCADYRRFKRAFDDGTTFVTDDVVIPLPGLRIDRLTNRAQ